MRLLCEAVIVTIAAVVCSRLMALCWVVLASFAGVVSAVCTLLEQLTIWGQPYPL
jgi:uncharacterized membrane protein